MSGGAFDAGDAGHEVWIEITSVVTDLTVATTARLAVRKLGARVENTRELALVIDSTSADFLVAKHITDDESFPEDGRYLGQVELFDVDGIFRFRSKEFPLPLVGTNEVAPLPPLVA